MLELEIDVDGTTEILEFEHSLVSLSKWESIHRRPYFRRQHDDPMTESEIESYFECMLVSGREHVKLLSKLTEEDKLALILYINSDMTATTITELDKKNEKPGKAKHVTSEVIYYWMVAFKIPQAYENWHLSRLMTLVRICVVEAEPEKKATPEQQRATAESFRELNERRRRESGSNG